MVSRVDDDRTVAGEIAGMRALFSEGGPPSAVVERAGAQDRRGPSRVSGSRDDCWAFVAALLPAVGVGAFYFGISALGVILASAAGCMVFDALLQRLTAHARRERHGRAALTGLLLGMSLPPASPGWLVALGCAAAIFLDAVVCRGLGFNPLNPALVARVALLLSFPDRMTSWSVPVGLFASSPDAVTSAPGSIDLLDGLIGRIPGGAGETSVVALALGGVFLLWRGVIGWQIPLAYVGSVSALAALFATVNPGRFHGPGIHLVTGGLFLGALFMATDQAGAPVTARGKIIFGAGCGALTWVLRSFWSYPAAVTVAILLMNLFAPLIDVYTRTRESAIAEEQA